MTNLNIHAVSWIFGRNNWNVTANNYFIGCVTVGIVTRFSSLHGLLALFFLPFALVSMLVVFVTAKTSELS